MRCLIPTAALLLTACSAETPGANEQAAPVAAAPAKETTGQRLARQKKYLSAINRHQLPASEGAATEVALQAIRANEFECQEPKARRFNSDGSIVAHCSGGRSYRVFNVEGMPDTNALDCVATQRLVGIDPCDEASIASGTDTSIADIMSSLKRING